jgi:hypothetical protein
MKKLLLVLLVLVAYPSWKAEAQLSTQYAFSASQATFTELTGGTVVPGFSADDVSSSPIPLGFNFNFEGVAYSQVTANTNGWLSFGNNVVPLWQTSNNFGPANITAIGPAVMPLWFDLDGASGVGSYQLDGIAPNRIFTFEWKNWEWNSSANTPVISFQAKLYETSDKIEFIYRQEAAPINPPNYFGVFIGIGTSGTDFWGLTSSTGNPVLSSVPALNGFNPLAFGKPATGQSYMFTPYPPCLGAPTTATIVSAGQYTCPDITHALSVTGYPLASGLSIQWESCPAGSGNFTPIVGASAPSFIVSGQTVATDYRCIITCNGTTSAPSDTFTLGMYPANLCYCVTGIGGTGFNNFSIDTVSILNTTLLNPSPGFSPGYYASYPPSGNTTAFLEQGGNYILQVAAGNITRLTGAWIDYDQNGTYNTNEFISFPSSPGSLTANAALTIPAGAVLGQTGMRVRVTIPGYPTIQDTSACQFLSAGETEDYIVNIVPAGTCTGTPTPGTVSASTGAACPAGPFDLTLSGFTVMSSVTLQWQSAPAGSGLFTDIPGANSSLHPVSGQSAATDYRCKVLCTSNNIAAYSDTLNMPQAPISDCYCIPQTTVGCNSPNNNHDIDDFILNGAAGAVINDTGTGCSPSSYADRTSLFASLDLIQGNNYPAVIVSHGYNTRIRVWIDFNDDGVFNTTDTVTPLLPIPTQALSFGIALPPTANPGVHRMRVRMFWLTNLESPCDLFTYGETHDYEVKIIAAQPADIGVAQVQKPLSGATYCSGDAVSLRVKIENQGFLPQSGFIIKADYDGPSPGSLQAVYNGVLPPFSNDTITIGSFVAGAPGTYSITAYHLLAGDNNYLNDTSHSSFIVLPTPQVDLGNDVLVCPDELPYIADAGLPGLSYEWNTGDALQQLPLVDEGLYWVDVTNQSGCYSRDTLLLSMKPLPSIAGISVAGTNNTFTFAAGLPQNVQNFYWDLGDGTYSTSPSVVHEYTASGTYPIQLIVTNECGADTAHFDILVLITGIASVNATLNSFSLHPNPASDQLFINWSTPISIRNIDIIDGRGAVVGRHHSLGLLKEYQVPVTSLPSGNYVLMISTEAGNAYRTFQIYR